MLTQWLCWSLRTLTLGTDVWACLVPQELRAGTEHVGEEALEQQLEAGPVGRGDAVPALWGPVVQVVDAVQVLVLGVPAQGRAHVLMTHTMVTRLESWIAAAQQTRCQARDAARPGCLAPRLNTSAGNQGVRNRSLHSTQAAP